LKRTFRVFFLNKYKKGIKTKENNKTNKQAIKHRKGKHQQHIYIDEQAKIK
jgi:hypothetical protein